MSLAALLSGAATGPAHIGPRQLLAQDRAPLVFVSPCHDDNDLLAGDL